MSEKLDLLITKFIEWSPKLLGAIVALIIGLWIIGLIMKVLRKRMMNSKMDKELVPFITTLISVILKVLLFVSVAGTIGFETTSFVALLGMLGLAIGMALQGTLGHFASGVMILTFKPYKVGDLVDIQGQIGTVDEIQVFNTIIDTLDNKKVIIPNGVATSGVITNLSANGILRVDLQIAMPYEEDFEKIRNIVSGAIEKTPKVLDDPKPVIEIAKFDANNLVLDVRPYATPDDYWDVYYGTYKNLKTALGEAGIKVAYPRALVHMEN
jgi:small conductance mechanosensitive channel